MSKKLYFIFMVSIMLSGAGYSQDKWELLVPSPTTNQLVSLDFIDENTGWAVGEYGTIVKTTDGGQNWRIIEEPWQFDLSDVNFPTSLVGYAVGTDGHIIKTTDGGESWVRQEIKYMNNLNRVRFRSENRGWIIGEKGMILYTKDGGVDWTRQTSNTIETLCGIDFVSDSGLCVVGDNNTILLTSNNGQTWESITYDDPNGSDITYLDVFFNDEASGWIGGSLDGIYGKEGILLKSQDGGASWERISQRPKVKLCYTHQTNQTKEYSVFILLPIQQIYYNTNSNAHLSLLKCDHIHQTDYFDGALCYSADSEEWRFSINGLANTYHSPGRFQFINDSKVIATGYKSNFLFSEDAGKTWNFENNNEMWWENLIVGKNGNLMHYRFDIDSSFFTRNFYMSSDFGENWVKFIPQFKSKQNTPIQDVDDFFSVIKHLDVFNLNDTLWTYFNQSAFFSIDLGKIWRQGWENVVIDSVLSTKRTPKKRYIPIFITPDTLMVCGLFPDDGDEDNRKSEFWVNTSVDGGKHFYPKTFHGIWNDVTPPSKIGALDNLEIKYIFDSHFFNGREGFLIGSDGNILKTTDTGNTWTSIHSGVIEDLFDIEFINNEIGFIGGGFGRILKTTDGGTTWYKTNNDAQQQDIYSIAFRNEFEGWAGSNNRLLYTNDQGENWTTIPLRYEHSLIRHLKFDNLGNGYAFTFFNSFPSTLYPRRRYRHPLFVGVENKYILNEPFPFNYTYLLRLNENMTGVDVTNKNIHLCETISLAQNYPNPFNMSTNIIFNLPASGNVKLRIFNVQGQLVKILINEKKSAGSHTAIWNGRTDRGNDVTSGMYLYRVEFKGSVKTGKMLLIK